MRSRLALREPLNHVTGAPGAVCHLLFEQFSYDAHRHGEIAAMIPATSVRESMGNYVRFENRWDHPYGYLWWHRTYRVGERAVHSIQLRGAGDSTSSWCRRSIW